MRRARRSMKAKRPGAGGAGRLPVYTPGFKVALPVSTRPVRRTMRKYRGKGLNFKKIGRTIKKAAKSPLGKAVMRPLKKALRQQLEQKTDMLLDKYLGEQSAA